MNKKIKHYLSEIKYLKSDIVEYKHLQRKFALEKTQWDWRKYYRKRTGKKLHWIMYYAYLIRKEHQNIF
jgi:hypothetical protein